jgi:hypothetical protein
MLELPIKIISLQLNYAVKCPEGTMTIYSYKNNNSLGNKDPKLRSK